MYDWEWSCRKCGKLGPYSGSDYKYPRGWRFSLVHGLVCSYCAKKYNIRTSDIEKEAPTIKKKVVKKSWEVL